MSITIALGCFGIYIVLLVRLKVLGRSFRPAGVPVRISAARAPAGQTTVHSRFQWLSTWLWSSSIKEASQQHTVTYRVFPCLSNIWDHTVLHSDHWLRSRDFRHGSQRGPCPCHILSKFPLKTGESLASSASSQENRQKWREFCYGFENLKEWATQVFYGFSTGFLCFCAIRKLQQIPQLAFRVGSVNPDLHRYCSAVLMEEEALKFTTDDGRCPLQLAVNLYIHTYINT